MPIGDVESVQSTTQLSNPAGSGELDKTAFLKLLVAQMQHQDPLEPMSNTEFVAQLAQFSGVEQLVAVNEGINLLQYQQMSMSNAQASSFIGKEVEVRSDKVQVDNAGDPVLAGFRLNEDAAGVKVNIRDQGGAIVRSLELGPKEAGEVSFEWDGRDENGTAVVPGSYRLDVVATDREGNPITWESRVRGVVDGVAYNSGYPELMIGSIKVTLGDVLGVYSGESEGASGDLNP